MKTLIRFFAAFLCLGLAACQTPMEHTNSALPRFNDKPVIRLDVSDIKINDEYEPTTKMPFIEHTFNHTPSEVIQSWVHDRLEAGGVKRRLEVTITDASVKETSLPPTPGLKGLFTNDQEARYDASVKLEARIYEDGKIVSIAEATATAQMSNTIAENATLVERDQFFDKLTLDVVTKATNELEKNMRQYFAPYIR